MLNYFLNDDTLVRGSDLRDVIDAINANEVYTDFNTIQATKGNGGTFLSVVDQYGGGGGAGGATSTNPFQISVEKIEDVQHARITGGTVFTNVQNFIPENTVDISSYSAGQTIYLYLKVANNWLSGTELMEYPALTVLGTTNFFANSVKFPAPDFGHYYYQIGQITVEYVGVPELEYTISQIANENPSIDGLNLQGFSGHSFLAAKTSDTATDTQEERFVNKGFAKLPDSSNVSISTTRDTSSISTARYGNLIIDSTLNSDGFYENFTAELLFENDEGTDTSTKLYFPVATFTDSAVTQNQTGNFISDGRVW